MSTPIKADPGTHDFVRGMMDEFRPDLAEAGVTVAVRWALAPEGEEHAIKVKGYPCLATIAITPLKYRVLGVADAQLDLDQAKWQDLSDDEKIALVDHELHHLELVPHDDEDDPAPHKVDDAGRPKLRMRPHDWEIGGFDAIAQRHKENAAEVKGLRSAMERASQATFPWG